ncbi:MAG: iron-containing alcohol dehydrogenase family protein [Clostridiales bacterium]|nr:iron-containing alcohol dehydrogenase family protein [Clostridiales bacterium]
MTDLLSMPLHTMPPSPAVTLGPQAYQALPARLLPLGRQALLIGGRRALAAGQQALLDALQGSGIQLDTARFAGECTLAQAQALAARARLVGAAAILGMGGGKAIDTAKLAAQLAGLPVFTLPTIPATCAALTALSVVHEDVTGDSHVSPLVFLDSPPNQVFLHTGILSQAPLMYLRAGIGDSLAKHVESAFKAGDGPALPYADQAALSLARLGYETLLRHGRQALDDAARGLDSAAFRLVTQCCVVNTGLVSLWVDERFNGGLAHALFYVLRDVPGFDSLLHGEAVAWGCLVQLAVENKLDEAGRLRGSLRALGLPVSLRERGIDLGLVLSRLPQALAQPDLVYTPYPVSLQSVQDALTLCEAQSLERGTC